MKKASHEKETRTRGSVTIFLTLVLIPCMIFTCVFADVSRVELSKAQAASAADLALYSLMANYDEELKEWYGLMASVSSIDDFYKKSEEFFTGMMTSKGLDGKANEMLTGYLHALQNGDDFSDFLQVEIVKDGKGGMISDIPNNIMGNNPALIEDGIVEFMKYRGPVEIVKNLVDRFKGLDIVKQLTEAEKNKPVTEAKEEYAEADSEMRSELLNTFVACLVYNDFLREHENLSYSSFSTINNELNQIRNDMELAAQLITSYYSYTDGMEDISDKFPNIGSPSINAHVASFGNTSYNFDNIGAYQVTWTEKISTGNKNEDSGEEEFIEITHSEYHISSTTVNSLVSNVDTKIKRIESLAADITKAVSGIQSPVLPGETGAAENDINPAWYCMKMQNTISTETLKSIRTEGAELMKQLAKIQLARNVDVLPDGAESILSSAANKLYSLRSNYLTYTQTNTDFEKILKRYKQVYDSCHTSVSERRYELNWDYLNASKATLGDYLQQVKNKYVTLQDDIDTQIKNIDHILKGGKVTYQGENYTAVSLDKLLSVMNEMDRKRNAWGDAAQAAGTDYGNSEYKDYQATSSDAGEGAEGEGTAAARLGTNPATAIANMKARLNSIRADLVKLKTATESITFGGTKVIGATREPIIKAGKKVIPTTYTQIDSRLSENKIAASGYYASLVKPASGTTVFEVTPLSQTITGNEPDLDKEGIRPELYNYMREAFDANEISSKNKNKNKVKDKLKSLKESSKKEGEDSQKIDNIYVKNLGGEIGSKHSGTTYSALKALGGIIDVVKAVISGNITTFRDKIYYVEYVMDMFTYSSFDNEGQYRIAAGIDGDDAEKKPSNSNPPSLADFKDAGGYYTAGKTKWETINVTNFTENVSLTNHPLTKANNAANLAEVEYILYGKGSTEECLKASYNQIFAIRELLNLTSGFQLFFSGDNETARMLEIIATTVTGATMGLVPEVLTKCVLIGVLATIETAHDLNRLKAGIPVALYKSKDENWFCSLKIPTAEDASDFDIDSNPADAMEPNDENGLFYSDYLRIFLLLGVENDTLYNAMLLRTGDVINANMKLHNDKFDLNKSKCFFQLNAKLKVKPLFLDLPIARAMDSDLGDNSVASLISKDNWCTYSVKMVRGYS